MSEEQLTKILLLWLSGMGWDIVAFDFPQSGTGARLHPNGTKSEKNKDVIIPDIIAFQNGICVFFENKDRYYPADYQKMNKLINSSNYSIDIDELLSGKDVAKIYYGIGLPTDKHTQSADKSKKLVDFVVGVNKDESVSVLYEKTEGIF